MESVLNVKCSKLYSMQAYIGNFSSSLNWKMTPPPKLSIHTSEKCFWKIMSFVKIFLPYKPLLIPGLWMDQISEICLFSYEGWVCIRVEGEEEFINKFGKRWKAYIENRLHIQKLYSKVIESCGNLWFTSTVVLTEKYIKFLLGDN